MTNPIIDYLKTGVGISPRMEQFTPLHYQVSSLFYSRHESNTEGKKDTLKVTYYQGDAVLISEYICIYHPLGSFPRAKADDWCKRRKISNQEMRDYVEGLDVPPPLEPIAIKVDDREKYPRIVKYIFED